MQCVLKHSVQERAINENGMETLQRACALSRLLLHCSLPQIFVILSERKTSAASYCQFKVFILGQL